jgi:signal transduction histidine kinase
VAERFYRGDASRGTPGVGLGLSLVAAVAELHGGSLQLSDNCPGLRATLLLFPMPHVSAPDQLPAPKNPSGLRPSLFERTRFAATISIRRVNQCRSKSASASKFHQQA